MKEGHHELSSHFLKNPQFSQLHNNYIEHEFLRFIVLTADHFSGRIMPVSSVLQTDPRWIPWVFKILFRIDNNPSQLFHSGPTEFKPTHHPNPNLAISPTLSPSQPQINSPQVCLFLFIQSFKDNLKLIKIIFFIMTVCWTIYDQLMNFYDQKYHFSLLIVRFLIIT